MKTVAIVMRSKNDAAYIGHTLEALRNQRFADFNIFSIDDSSTDSTRCIIDSFGGVEKIEAPEGEYFPGRNMNRAVEACIKLGAKIVVFNNADSVPANSDWLGNLVDPILCGRADFCYARQIARCDAYEWIKRDYVAAFSDKALSIDFFSAASCAFSSKVFDKLTFDESIKFSEDVMFSKRARSLGFRLAYVPDSIAEHSHNYSIKSAEMRFAGEGAAEARIFVEKNSIPIYRFLREFAGAAWSDFKWLARAGKIREYPKALRFRFAQKRAFWSAYASERKRISK